MYYPFVEQISKDAEMISTFGGVDKGVKIGENFFGHMKNMTGDSYPLLSARVSRGTTGLPEGVEAFQICNTYGTRADTEINEDVFALVRKVSGEAKLEFRKADGDSAMAAYTLGGEAEGTTLIPQAGYVYAFPQAVRRSTYGLGGEALYNEIEVRRITKADGQGLLPTVKFVMQPSDSEGRTGDGISASRAIDGVYSADSSDTRGSNQLILVTKSGLSVNENGVTVYVGSDGIVKKRRGWTAETIDLSKEEASYALTAHGTAREWLDKYCTEGMKVAVSGMRVDVYDSNAYIVVTEKPDSPANGTVWWDKKTGDRYVWSSAFNEWTAVTQNYILLTYSEGGVGDYNQVFEVLRNGEIVKDNNGSIARRPFEGFKENDAISIKGISEEVDSSYTIAKVTARGLILNGIVKDVYEKQINTMTIGGVEGDVVSLKRSVPKMDYVIECNNRLWGCYYGVDENGNVINEIYAAALGDPTNWRRYEGIATDSWTATIGTDGPFTGAVTYGGYPLFFKENAIIRVYGTAPSSFQIATYNYRGVQKGSAKSLAICDEVLYYLSNDGVMAYNGSVPQKVSEALGDERYHSGVAGSIGSKYYLSCLDSSEKAHLFVFNSLYGIWHEEDDLRAEQFVRHKGQLYILANGKVLTACGEGEKVRFEAITGEWGLSNP